jgi:hypothetical protein
MESSSDISKAADTSAEKASERVRRLPPSVSRATTRFKAWAAPAFKHLRKKGLDYWLIIAFLIPISCDRNFREVGISQGSSNRRDALTAGF